MTQGKKHLSALGYAKPAGGQYAQATATSVE